jgi:hypothetical protein
MTKRETGAGPNFDAARPPAAELSAASLAL